MNRKLLFALWAGLFIVCAALGFIPEVAGLYRALLTALSVLFFVPPALLLYQARRTEDLFSVKLVGCLSALSLALTLALLVANFLFALRSEALGTALHQVLVIVSSPMVCSGYWVLSLFLWACLLMASLMLYRQLRKRA